jgi:hypothetical protein
MFGMRREGTGGRVGAPVWHAGTSSGGRRQPARAKVMLTPFRKDPCVESETDWLEPPIDTDSKPVMAPPPIDSRILLSEALPEMVPVWL